jgi:hypothetical protein
VAISILIELEQHYQMRFATQPQRICLPFRYLSLFRRACQRLALVVVGRDEIKLREQEKLEARKMLENAAESPPSTARFVSLRFLLLTK